MRGCAAFSPACDINLVMEACQIEKPLMPLREVIGIVGREVLEQFRQQPELLKPYDLFELARKQDAKPVKPKLFVTCGTEDFIHQMSVNLAQAMKPLHYDFTYLEWPGIHEWYFWDESIHLAFEHFSRSRQRLQSLLSGKPEKGDGAVNTPWQTPCVPKP